MAEPFKTTAPVWPRKCVACSSEYIGKGDFYDFGINVGTEWDNYGAIQMCGICLNRIAKALLPVAEVPAPCDHSDLINKIEALENALVAYGIGATATIASGPDSGTMVPSTDESADVPVDGASE